MSPSLCLAAALTLLAAPAAMAQPQPQSQPQQPAPEWLAGQTNDGRQQFARISRPPHRLTYLCQRGGPDMLMIEGLTGTPETLRLTIDDRPLALRFTAHGPRRSAPAQLGSPLMRALFAGRTVTLSDESGMARFSLEGAERAMRHAISRCLRRK